MTRQQLAAGFQRAAMALLLCAAHHAPVGAQTEVGIAYWKGKVPAAPDAITALGPELFGDRVNLYNGTFHFEQVDVELPGNNTLRVALDRQHTPGRQWLIRGAMADWDLNTPRITGYFAEHAGWVPTYGTASSRCSGFNMPPGVASSGWNAQDFSPDEYWHGTQLVVPGHGSQEILARTASLPVPAGQWNLVTRNLWLVGCLPSVVNAAGQGFIARSPDGTTYRFNWMASRVVPSLRKGDAVLGVREMALMATEVTDRFGNRVTYTYNAANPWLLERIESSDGRVITLSYAGGRVSEVFDGTRRWRYQYDPQGDLQYVILPDESRWTFSLRSLVVPSGAVINDGGAADCDTPPSIMGYPTSGFMIHPSGAKGTFFKNFTLQGRSNVQRICTYYSGELAMYTNGSVFPRESVIEVLDKKIIEGPGLAALTWTYVIGGEAFGSWAPCASCPDRKTTVVVEPDGTKTRHSFGIVWRQNDAQLLRVERVDALGNVLNVTDHQYRNAAGQAYPDAFGTSVRFSTDLVSTLNRPLERRQTTQQGVQFVWQAEAGAAGLDEYARPKRVKKESGLGFVKEETQTYYDSPSLWVLGQPLSLTNHSASGAVPESHTYSPTNALREASFEFGRRIASFAYNPDGTLATVHDAADRPIVLQQFMRGKPQRAVFADGTVASRVVNNLGNVVSETNEVGTTTSYTFDAMGRVASINYPTGDPVAYAPTIQSFNQIFADERGLTAGHWRQSINTGNAYRYRYFDALWRVRLDVSFDANDTAGTASFKETRYDAKNRKSFESYPSRAFSVVDQAIAGTSTSYDALDRIVQQRAHSELGLLTTDTEYLSGFRRRVTNPRGNASTFSFQAFDTPSEDNIAAVSSPESVSLSILRDVFGKPLSITRGGTWSGGTQSLTRSYVYTADQRLCKTIEPETGATVQAYDLAGNVAWRASGLALPSTSNCDHGSVPASARTNFSYDSRDRLTWTTFGDGSRTIERHYWPDGLLKHVFSGNVWWTYHYNNRRLPTHEEYTWWSGARPGEGWNLVWDYDAGGNVRSLRDPWGTLHYSPNALGQMKGITFNPIVPGQRPEDITGYAKDISYHPNGAVAGYTLNNGITHTLRQNVRGLPEESRDIGVTSDLYAYDANGNVTSILDQQEGVASRNMSYDGLDRLKVASGSWGSGLFGYDALDNLRSSTVGGRSLSHNIDANNRLASLSGSQSIGIGYDLNGNVTQRGSQAYVFDIGNRMLSVPGKVNSYLYDGHGRRGLAFMADGTWRLYAYGRDGKLRVSHRSDHAWTRYIYIGDKLIAETMSAATTYVHTDALGSPVAKTNSIGALVSRTRYEPYGATAAGTNPIGVGFTGHVNDADTGLVYMQQRYYDPIAGRFLSVDPVVTDDEDGSHFNRYVYANNNPFRFIDPDGRSPCTGTRIEAACGMFFNTVSDAQIAIQSFQASVENWASQSIAAVKNEKIADGAEKLLSGLGPVAAARTALSRAAAKGVPQLAAPVMHQHHLMPRQFKEFFGKRGIDIDAHAVSLGEKSHLTGVHGKGLGNMPGGWNKEWAGWISNNPNASAKDVYQQLGTMMDRYKINDLPIHPYKP